MSLEFLQNNESGNLTERPEETQEIKHKRKETIIDRQRRHFLEIMEGKTEKDKEYEAINPFKFVPQSMKYALGGDFDIRPGEWWQTKASQRERIIRYPRSFAFIPKGLQEKDPKEYKKYVDVMTGGICHEQGHHIGEIQALQGFMIESDTSAPLVLDIGIKQEAIKEAKIKANTEITKDALKQNDLRKYAEYNILGDFPENILFLSDLQNITADIVLEAYEKQHIDYKFAKEAKTGLDALNGEIFNPQNREYMGTKRGMPRKLLLSTQFRNALVQKKGRIDSDKTWGESGFDVWFKEEYVDTETRDELKNITNAYTNLESLRPIFERIGHREKIRFMRDKIMPAYREVRNAYLRLLKKDIDEEIKKEDFQQKKGGEGQEGEEQEGEGQGGEGQEGVPQEGDKKSKKKTKWDELSPEEKEKIINSILDRVEKERVSHDPIDKDEKEQKEKIRKIIRGAIKPKDEDKNNKEAKVEGKKESNDTEDPNSSIRIRREAVRRSQEAQRHMHQTMQERLLLDLSEAEYREYQKAYNEMYSPIQHMSQNISKEIRKKISLHIKRGQTHGQLPPEKIRDFFSELSDGNPEPTVFEQQKIERNIPRFNILFLLDHSGSMSENVEQMAKVVLVATEGIEGGVRIARNNMTAKANIPRKENLFRAGMITFDTEPFMRQKLENYTEKDSKKTNAKMYIAAKNISGGGTADAGALKETVLYLKEEKKKEKNIKSINCVVVVTDGQGERNVLQNIFAETKNLKNTFFIAVGAGDGTEDVVSSWNELKGAPIVAFQVKDKDMKEMPNIVERNITSNLRDYIIRL